MSFVSWLCHNIIITCDGEDSTAIIFFEEKTVIMKANLYLMF